MQIPVPGLFPPGFEKFLQSLLSWNWNFSPSKVSGPPPPLPDLDISGSLPPCCRRRRPWDGIATGLSTVPVSCRSSPLPEISKSHTQQLRKLCNRRAAARRGASSPSLAVVDASGIRNAVRFAARPRAHYRHPKGEKIFDSWQISASVNGNERRHGFFSQPFTQVGLFLNMYMRVWWRYGCGFQFYSAIYLYMCVLLFYIKLHLLAWKLFVFAHRGGNVDGDQSHDFSSIPLSLFLPFLIPERRDTRHPNIRRSFPYLFAQTFLFHVSPWIFMFPIVSLLSSTRYAHYPLRWNFLWICKITQSNGGEKLNGVIIYSRYANYFQWRETLGL